MAQVCRAGNGECGLTTGTSLLADSLRALRCDICCAEPGFCLECKCILCGKVIPPDCEWIQCLEKIGNGVCGHSAHLECALSCNMAGVFHSSSLELDVQYLCRRCDKTMDLLPRAILLMQSVPAAPSKEIKERMASFLLRLVHGTKREDVKAALKASKEGGARTEKPEIKKLEKTDDRPNEEEKAADEKPNQDRQDGVVELEAGPVPMEVVPMEEPLPANVEAGETNAPSEQWLDLEDNNAHNALVTRGQLSLRYQDEIERALANLKRVQEQEVLVAREKLVSQMNSLLNEYQLFESDRFDSLEETNCAEFTEKMQEHLRKLKSEREKFDSMLQIGQGFSCVSRELLQTLFNWPPSQS